MGYVVLDHHLDGDVYRLVLGWEELHEVGAVDDDGNPVYAESENEGDERRQLTTEVAVHTQVEDFLFAADDERWRDKAAGDIAAEQRKLVADALVEREQAENPPATAPRPLPGIGDALEF